MKKRIAFATLALLLSGCATPSEKRNLEAKIQSEPPVASSDQLAARGTEAILKAPGVSEEQKEKVIEVFNRTQNESKKLGLEIGQAKSLLFKEIATADAQSREVAQLKNRIASLDRKRLQLMFNALADVQTVLGKNEQAEAIYKHFAEYENPAAPYSQQR